MMKHEDFHFVLDDGPEQDFTSSKLQIGLDGSPVSANRSNARNIKDPLPSNSLLNGNVTESGSQRKDESPSSESQKLRPTSLAVVPWSGENARDFFSYRDGLVTSAVQECIKELLTADDGEFYGSWLLTEISFWDHEKERLVLLTSKYLCTIKYDFIALKQLSHRKIPLKIIDTIVIGELSYPPSSLIPSRKISGVRAMWNSSEPLTFIKKWNPFSKEIPFTTFTSHPLLWHKDGAESERATYDVDDFISQLTNSLTWKQNDNQCRIELKPILLENYIGLGSLIHNKNSLGFFKVRGKFSF